jgi:hypothetical protein
MVFAVAVAATNIVAAASTELVSILETKPFGRELRVKVCM